MDTYHEYLRVSKVLEEFDMHQDVVKIFREVLSDFGLQFPIIETCIQNSSLMDNTLTGLYLLYFTLACNYGAMPSNDVRHTQKRSHVQIDGIASENLPNKFAQVPSAEHQPSAVHSSTHESPKQVAGYITANDETSPSRFENLEFTFHKLSEEPVTLSNKSKDQLSQSLFTSELDIPRVDVLPCNATEPTVDLVEHASHTSPVCSPIKNDLLHINNADTASSILNSADKENINPINVCSTVNIPVTINIDESHFANSTYLPSSIKSHPEVDTTASNYTPLPKMARSVFSKGIKGGVANNKSTLSADRANNSSRLNAHTYSATKTLHIGKISSSRIDELRNKYVASREPSISSLLNRNSSVNRMLQAAQKQRHELQEQKRSALLARLAEKAERARTIAEKKEQERVEAAKVNEQRRLAVKANAQRLEEAQRLRNMLKFKQNQIVLGENVSTAKPIAQKPISTSAKENIPPDGYSTLALKLTPPSELPSFDADEPTSLSKPAPSNASLTLHEHSKSKILKGVRIEVHQSPVPPSMPKSHPSPKNNKGELKILSKDILSVQSPVAASVEPADPTEEHDCRSLPVPSEVPLWARRGNPDLIASLNSLYAGEVKWWIDIRPAELLSYDDAIIFAGYPFHSRKRTSSARWDTPPFSASSMIKGTRLLGINVPQP